MEQEVLLEKYFKGTLTQTEQQEFDALLRKNADFKAEVAFQADVRTAVEAEEDDNFRSMLSDFESEVRSENRYIGSTETDKRTFSTKWLVAASIALLARLTYVFILNQPTLPQELFAQNFKPYRNVTHPITRGEEAIDTKTRAFATYAKGDYKEAIPLFGELYTSEKEAYYLFYQANALIQVNRAAEAVPLLQKHLKTEDSLTDKSNWYLAMAYLQLGDTAKAKETLKKVEENNSYKTAEARQLLDAF